MKIKNNLEKEKNINLELIKSSNFIKQLMAMCVSRFGDGIDTIAFSWLTYKLTGSTVLVATLFAVNGVPNIIFGVLSGGLCNYLSKKTIISICDFGRAICVGLIAILSISGNIEVWHLYIITFLNSSFESFRGPAATSMLPKVISNEQLDVGIAMNTSSSKLSEIIGLAMAPVIIATISIEFAIIIDALTFLICGILISLLKVEDKLAENKLTYDGYKNDLKEGLRYIVKDKLVLNICIFGTLINALIVPYNALQAPFVEKVLNKGPEAMTLMNIPLTIAMTIGVVFIPKLKTKFGGRNIFIWGGVVFGVNYCLLVLNQFIKPEFINYSIVVETFLMGLGIMFINFPIQVAMYKRVESEYLSRVSSIINAVALSAVPIASVIIGGISAYLSVGVIFIIFGLGTTVMFITQYFNKEIKKLNDI